MASLAHVSTLIGDGTILPEPTDAPLLLSAGRYDSFVVRVSRRDAAAAELAVRGQVTHVASGRTMHFTDLERLLAFIQTQLQLERRGTSVDGV